MSLCISKSFSSSISDLNDQLSRKDVDFGNVNIILDQINALDFPNSFPGEEESVNLIIKCCTCIPPENSLLVAKSCNLILNHLLRNKVTLSDQNLESLLAWVNEAFKKSTDVAYLDILQLVHLSLKNYPDFFITHGVSLLPFLFEKLESKARILQANDIKLWRIYSFQALSKILLKDDRSPEVNELLDIAYSQLADNLLIHAKVWRTVIETLDSLSPKGNSKWVVNKLNYIIGLVEAACVLGLKGASPPRPKQIYPSAIFTPEPQNAESPGRNNNTSSGKKKQKSKSKRLNWTEKGEKDDSCRLMERGCRETQGLEISPTAWPTSDSESGLSDTEAGQKAKLAKEQAKTRHAACNLIIRLTNNLKGKQLYGYYNVLLNALLACLKSENSQGSRMGALAAVAALLLHSKPLLSQAQHSEGLSYVGFSESLSVLISSLHSCLVDCLSYQTVATQVFNCLSTSLVVLQTTAVLISVTPYHRLRPNLLTTLFSSLQIYLRRKDSSVTVGALKCLNEIASLDPGCSEQKDILQTGLKFSELSSSAAAPWVVSFVTSQLKGEGANEALKLICWQLIGSLAKHHFELLESSLSSIKEFLFIDLQLTNSNTQLYATYALKKLLEALILRENLGPYSKELWLYLLNGPLVTLLQSPEVVACEACDCLASMGPIVFNSLKEEEQILVVTLIFGCINHEKATVRAAAVNSLGFFLLFPQMTSNEQFLFDSKELLIKSLSDESLSVRIKGAWAFGNLIDLIINNLNEDAFGDFSFKDMLKSCLELTKDGETVKSYILRAIGLLLSAMKDEVVCDEFGDVLDKSIRFLFKCSSSGSKMKTRWNACHAISSMLKNKVLLPFCEKWMLELIQTLCNLIVSCSNFKVRANACTALCQIPARSYFGSLYIFVWTSLLDGLDNSLNMPDFREYKHQDSLKQHLCSAICHVTTLLRSEDLAELEVALDYRLESLRLHLAYFQAHTLPEHTAISVAAVNNLQALLLGSSSPQHSHFLLQLKETLAPIQVH